MSSPGSVTSWIGHLKAGDHTAVKKLMERYFQRLVGLARKKLQGTPRQAADEEDVALSAFASFCRAAERGQFPQLQDRDGLWHFLKVITVRKALDQAKSARRQKRGGPAPGVTRLSDEGAAADEAALAQILSREPTPELAAQVAEEFKRLLDCLKPELREIALLKLDGYKTEEIAAKLRCAARTIERKLRLIRKTWKEELGS
jgi:RNA polymerase sigma factor (sigma-70 family)